MTIWILLVIALVLTLGACTAIRRKPANERANIASFVPGPKNDKVIVVKGWDEDELRRVINDFVATYKDDRYPSYSIEPHKQSDETFRLTFPNDIHPLLFTFLVNYIAYPFDVDLSRHSIVVIGKTTLNSLYEGIDVSLAGQQAILYLPEDDQDRDVVYMQTTAGVTFANSFSELTWKRVNDPRLSGEVKRLMDTS